MGAGGGGGLCPRINGRRGLLPDVCSVSRNAAVSVGR